MSEQVPNSGETTRTMVWAIVILGSVTLVAVVILAVFGPEDRADGIIVQVLASLPATLAVLAAIRQVGQVSTDLQSVKDDTRDLTNGLLDAKVRLATAEVLPDDLVDPAYHAGGRQADQVRRDLQDPDAAGGVP